MHMQSQKNKALHTMERKEGSRAAVVIASDQFFIHV